MAVVLINSVIILAIANRLKIMSLLNNVLFVSLMLLPGLAVGQDYSLKAMVTSKNSTEKLKGEFLILDPASGNLLRAGEIDTNNIFVEGLTGEKLLLKIYEPLGGDTSILITNTDHKTLIDLGEIQLNSAVQLNEVEVRAKKTIFEKTPDGSRINIENTLLAASSNATEMLGKMPGITISSGKINVFSRGEAALYLNGREITFEILKSLPPGEITSIEIITNPGAKYDAKGKAVVIINMKKGYAQGLLVTLTENNTLAFVKHKPLEKYYLNAANINLNYRKNAFSVTSYYANDAGLNWNENVYHTLISTNTGTYKTFGYYTEDNKSAQVHNYRLGLGLDLNNRNNITVQYDGLFNFFNLAVQQNGDYYSPAGNLTLIRMQNAATTRLINHSANVNYSSKLDTAGKHHFFSGLQYNNFGNRLLDNITETISPYNASVYTWNRVNDGNNRIEIYTAQADLSHQLKNLSIEEGFKLSETTNNGRIRFYTRPENASDLVENFLFSNGNIYKELIPAAYATVKGRYKKWSFNSGVRAEYSDVTGYSEKLKKYIVDSTYFNLFPSLKTGYRFNDKWNNSISYSRKITRPIYQDLDPFLWYLDSLTSIQGNPKLIPELLDQVEYNLSFKQLNLKLAYTLSHNTIWSVMRRGLSGPNSVVYVKDNIQRRHIFTTSLDLPFESAYYITYNTLACNLYQFYDNRSEYQVGKVSPQLYFYSYHQFLIPKLFNIDLSFEYYGTSSDGFTDKRPYYYLSPGISRSFFNDKLSCQLLFNDVLRSARWQGQRVLGTYTNNYNQRVNSHFLRLSISWKFGALKNISYKNKTINDKEFNRIRQ